MTAWHIRVSISRMGSSCAYIELDLTLMGRGSVISCNWNMTFLSGSVKKCENSPLNMFTHCSHSGCGLNFHLSWTHLFACATYKRFLTNLKSTQSSSNGNLLDPAPVHPGDVFW